MGSSPHMRGTRYAHHFHAGIYGIIPAYAGNTPAEYSIVSCWRDHPRICGEHRAVFIESTPPTGSSPHMRGTPGIVRFSVGRAGIIPAYAGNTPNVRPMAISSRDHPRICGEHHFHRRRCRRVRGSSPHMRGTLSLTCGGVIHRGIIPAYAGNTTAPYAYIECSWDHPRICGEHLSPSILECSC